MEAFTVKIYMTQYLQKKFCNNSEPVKQDNGSLMKLLLDYVKSFLTIISKYFVDNFLERLLYQVMLLLMKQGENISRDFKDKFQENERCCKHYYRENFLIGIIF